MLAACSGGSFLAEREPWRKEAEARCIGSGAVHEGAGIVRVRAINGPGMCGADFPMKVSMIGQTGVLGFGAEMRPPAAIPNVARPAPPRWPIAEPSDERPPYQPPRTVTPAPNAPTQPGSTVYSRPLPPPQTMPSAPYDAGAQPLSIDPPGAAGPPQELYDFRRPYGGASSPPRAPARAPVRAAPIDAASPAYDLSPEPYERRRT
ncbi:MAG: hypothetical protein ACRECO_01535, partial [Xanthobacteraceae bacterium]